jgi:small conductance mechanosensitive channel
MTLDDLERWFRSNGLEAVLIALGAVLLARLARWGADRLLEHAERETDQERTDDLIASEARKHRGALAQVFAWSAVAIIYFVAGMLILERLNVPLTSLVAPATVAGAAIGFGAQNVVRDLLSGFFIFAERQYGYGDIVRIGAVGETKGITGAVEEVTLRATKLRSEDGELVVIPNGEIKQVTNLSKDWARAVLDVPISIDADVTRATAVLREVGDEIAHDGEWAPLILDAPSVMGIQKIGVDSLQLRFVARTLPGKQWEVGRELRGRIARAFYEAGIRAPMPVVNQAAAQ